MPKPEKVVIPKAVSIEPSSSPTPATAASAENLPSVSKAELSIEIENGSGITGEAGKIKTYLADQGYLGHITTRNASTTASGSTIAFGKNVDTTTQAELMKVLKSQLPNIAVIQASPSANVQIIIGK